MGRFARDDGDELRFDGPLEQHLNLVPWRSSGEGEADAERLVPRDALRIRWWILQGVLTLDRPVPDDQVHQGERGLVGRGSGPQVGLEGIEDRAVGTAHFEMEMRRRGAAGAPDLSQRLSGRDALPDGDLHRPPAEVEVARTRFVRVGQFDEVRLFQDPEESAGDVPVELTVVD